MRSPMRRRRALLTYISAAGVSLLMALAACSAATPGIGAEPVTSTPPAAPSASTSPTSPPLAAPDPKSEPIDAVARLGAEPYDFPGDADISTPDTKNDDFNARTIQGTVKPADGITLGSLYWHATDYWFTEKQPAQSVSANGSSSFSVRGIEPGLIMSYQIIDPKEDSADPSGKTDFWIGAKYYSPLAGSANKWGCFIYKGTPKDGLATHTLLSPYVCSWSVDNGNNPTPMLTVNRATTVTDKVRGRQLLEKYCTNSTAKESCDFVNFGYDRVLDEAHALGSITRNLSSFDAEKAVGGEESKETTNSLEIEIGVEVKFWDIYKASLTAKYGHEWKNSVTFSEKTTVHMPEKSIAWMEYQPLMQVSEGSWVIDTGSERFVVPEFRMIGAVSPADGSQQVVYGCLLKNYDETTKKCTDPQVLSRSR